MKTRTVVIVEGLILLADIFGVWWSISHCFWRSACIWAWSLGVATMGIGISITQYICIRRNSREYEKLVSEFRRELKEGEEWQCCSEDNDAE